MAYDEGKAPLVVPKGEDNNPPIRKTAGSNPPPPKTDGR